MIKGSKILVTGGAGFIGSHLVEALLPYNKVKVIDDLSSGKRENLPNDPNLIFHRSSILNNATVQESVRWADYIFHMAADVGNIKSLEDPIYNMRVNVEGTINILEAARYNDHLKKIVFSSSSAVYGDVHNAPIPETAEIMPDSPYAVSKHSAEEYCLAYAFLYNSPIVILRYFNVYGTRQGYSEYANVIPVFVNHAINGTTATIFGTGDQTRDWVHVSDVVKANILAAEHSYLVTHASTYNIATGKGNTIKKLIAIIGSSIGKDIIIHHEPPRAGEVQHSRADISEAKDRLEYTPQVTLNVGIREYCNKELKRR